jgi:hypothetical protein
MSFSPHFLGRLEKPTLIYSWYSQLHASDLRSLSPSSSLATRLQDSPSSIQLPYVRFPPSSSLANYSPLQDLADKLAGLCGAQRLALPLDNAAVDLAPSSETFVSFPSLSSCYVLFFPKPGSRFKRVFSLSMPALTETAGARKRSVAELGACIFILITHPIIIIN